MPWRSVQHRHQFFFLWKRGADRWHKERLGVIPAVLLLSAELGWVHSEALTWNMLWLPSWEDLFLKEWTEFLFTDAHSKGLSVCRTTTGSDSGVFGGVLLDFNQRVFEGHVGEWCSLCLSVSRLLPNQTPRAFKGRQEVLCTKKDNNPKQPSSLSFFKIV